MFAITISSMMFFLFVCLFTCFFICFLSILLYPMYLVNDLMIPKAIVIFLCCRPNHKNVSLFFNLIIFFLYCTSSTGLILSIWKHYLLNSRRLHIRGWSGSEILILGHVITYYMDSSDELSTDKNEQSPNEFF